MKYIIIPLSRGRSKSLKEPDMTWPNCRVMYYDSKSNKFSQHNLETVSQFMFPQKYLIQV